MVVVVLISFKVSFFLFVSSLHVYKMGFFSFVTNRCQQNKWAKLQHCNVFDILYGDFVPGLVIESHQ